MNGIMVDERPYVPHPSVTFGPQPMDSASDHTQDRLARIEVKLDMVLSHFEDHENRIRVLESGEKMEGKIEQVEEAHSNRLTALERWRYGIPANLFVSVSAILVACIQFL